MPNRILRDWTDSEKINSLSPHAERFFTRLIMKVDDYGRFYADSRLLKANLFPLQLDSIREADIVRWVAECQKTGNIVLYDVNGKGYLQIRDFKQRLDRARAKYPGPPTNESVAFGTDFPPEEKLETKLETEGETSREILIKGESLDKAQEILNSQSWLEQVAMKSGKSLQFCKYRLAYFLNRESLKTEFEKKTINDVKDHFVNWIALQKEEAVKKPGKEL